jgi:GNAT superfamily N-acetyltransferase
LRGHRLDLGGRTVTYHHLYRLLCEICCIVEHHDPPARALAEWAHIDTSVRYSAGSAPEYGLVLVTEPPPHPGGTGYLHLRLDDTSVATIDVTLCGSCHRGTVHSVHVDQRYRRLGYGRTLIAAALTLQPTYTWTTESKAGTVASTAFWTTTGLRRSRIEDRCPHTA